MASGEEKAADAASAAAWRDKFCKNVASYSPDGIFKTDKSAFSYQMLPSKTVHLKGSSWKGGKKFKVRVSVLLCCNATGTRKLTPLAIGKYKKPLCMKNLVSLQCGYWTHSRALMK